MACDLLYNLVGVSEDDPPAEIGNAVRNSIIRFLPEHVDEIYPYLARLLDIPMEERLEEQIKYLTPEVLQERVLRAFSLLAVPVLGMPHALGE